jgi:hypothetical protein
MERFFLLLAALSLVLILTVLRSLRQERIRVEHSVSWLAGGFLLLVLSLSPGALSAFAEWLGLAGAPLAILMLALAVFVGIFYRQSRALSELKDMNITLTQRLAIVEFELRSRDETRT